ncbi:hypothetical protein SAMN02745945_00984 [Peptoclostridium litorale DSM 5388]|uniref:Uncharacterized protein n=1 Tax=Peptoclostridium litorale DSM 5388 TaxID=1121324 RepID=A0A069R9P5_PEPLI|nr:hypothetical protein [Peptoclostridium litorale]KDR93789.1 hypothetical protein CLIT_23c00610 [Peptoclostridium litorale DSM 5388]SIN85892.1 hypothetical protein SAMN02745945_00984 [Peptoclostridium litorale DSM 5388]
MDDKIFIEVEKESLGKFKTLCRHMGKSTHEVVTEYIDHVVEQNPIIFISKDEDNDEKKELVIKIDSEKAEKLRDYCKRKNITVQMLLENFIQNQVGSMDIA